MIASLTPPRRAVLAGVICLAVLGGMIVGHAWPLWTGRSVTMKVTPVDPRDPFRGEYVRLRTAANSLHVGTAGLPGDPPNRVTVQPLSDGLDNPGRGTVVYVQLEPSGTGDYVPVSISTTRAPNKLNLRGRVTYATAGSSIDVDYGLDAFYVQEGTGPIVESALREGRNVQIEVAIASSGQSRIRGLMVDGVRVGR